MIDTERESRVQTAKGHWATFSTRGDTNDEALLVAIVGADEYGLGKLDDLEGWALDIGSHIGSVAIALALDHPKLRVIAVEPVPDNARLIRASIVRNDLTDRVFLEEVGLADVGTSTVPCWFAYTKAVEDQGYVEQNRYIGNIWRVGSGVEGSSIDAKAQSITDLATKYGAERFVFTKIDCEGCEWPAFANDQAAICDVILGEYHDADATRMVALLANTHDVEILIDYGGSGLFRAVRR